MVFKGTLMAMVVGDICQESIGDCNDLCNQQCVSIHPGGSGFCKFDGTKNSCFCSYECKVNTCEINLAPTDGCDEEHCGRQCGFKFPGQGATGYCEGIFPYKTCHCTYFC